MGKNSRALVFCCAVVALILTCPTVQGETEPTPLKYHWLPDQKAVYAINIEADLPSSKATLAGNLYFTVKSIDDATGQITLSTSADLAPRNQPKPSSGFRSGPHFPGPSPFNDMQFNARREIVIDDTGKVIKNDGDAQLPFLLGELWSVALEPLPSERKPSWDVERTVEISSKHGRVWGLPPSMGYSETNMSAQENSHYELGKPATIDIVIAKKFELASDEKGDDGPVIDQKGEGTVTFDQVMGLVKGVNMKVITRVNQNNTSVRIPVTLTAKMLTAAEAEKVAAKRQTDMETARAKAAEMRQAKPLEGAEINVALIELKDRDMFTVKKACERFAATPPSAAYQTQVSKALEPLLNDRDHFVRIASAQALAVWGSKDNVAALTAIATDSDPFVKDAAKAALVSIMNGQDRQLPAK